MLDSNVSDICTMMYACLDLDGYQIWYAVCALPGLYTKRVDLFYKVPSMKAFSVVNATKSINDNIFEHIIITTQLLKIEKN